MGQNVPKLYKSVRVVQIVIVEDVLVLVYGRFVRHVRLVHGVLLVGIERFHAAADKPLQRKGVFLLVRLRRVSVVGVLFQIVFPGIERRQAPQLQDAPVAGHGGKLGGGHKLPAQPLGVLVVAFGLPSGAALRLHGDGGLAQPVLGNLLDGAGLPAPEEYHAVHVAEYRLGVLVVDCLTLGQLLVEQRQAHLPGADDRHQLFEVGHLPGVGGLVPQHPHMMGQAAPVYVVRPFAQEIEHLRKRQSYNKIVGGIGIADDEERRRPSVPQLVKLHLVIAHNLPELRDVKWGQPCATANKYGAGSLACCYLSRTYSSFFITFSRSALFPML